MPVSVRIVGVPVPRMEQTRQHFEAIARELQLIDLSHESTSSSSATRLLELVATLQDQYGGRSFLAGDEIANAHDRGDESIDLEFEVRPSARRPTLELMATLLDTDARCRSGELLTLETPPDCRALRTWFLSEVVRQLDGLPPMRWSGVRRDA